MSLYIESVFEPRFLKTSTRSDFFKEAYITESSCHIFQEYTSHPVNRTKTY